MTLLVDRPAAASRETLVRSLEVHGVRRGRAAAEAILALLDSQVLGLAQLARIFEHHTLRRRNQAKVVVKLVLVACGEGESVPEAAPDSDAWRLSPDGWFQVTRTAWALRSQPAWAPAAVLRADSLRCAETAERVLLVADDGDEAPDKALVPASARRPP